MSRSPRHSRSTRVDKLARQRHALILDHLRSKGTASIQTLAKALEASSSTIRRDLTRLAEEGYVDRLHGGAALRATPTTFEPSFATATEIARAEKRAIAAIAAHQIPENASVIFDSGSTMFEMAEAVLKRGIRITAVTHDIAIAQLFAQSELITLVVPGGTLRRGSFTLLGEPGEGFLRSLHADLAFLSVHSVAKCILADTTIDVAEMKKAIMGAGQRVFVLADSSKFEHPAFCGFAHVADVEAVITDDGLSKAAAEELSNAGAKVIVAKLTEMTP